MGINRIRGSAAKLFVNGRYIGVGDILEEGTSYQLDLKNPYTETSRKVCSLALARQLNNLVVIQGLG